MAVSMPRKKSKKSKKQEEDPGFSDSCLFRFFSKISITFLFILIIFLWSFSTTIISGSIVHVCVTSRKLNNLYCLSAGAQPANNYDVSLPVVNNGSNLSVVDKHMEDVSTVAYNQKVPPTDAKFSLNISPKTLISLFRSPPVAAAKPENPFSKGIYTAVVSAYSKLYHNVDQKSSVSSPPSPPIAVPSDGDSASGSTETSKISSTTITSTPASVLRDNADIQLPSTKSSSEHQVNDDSDMKTSVQSDSANFSLFAKAVFRRGVDEAKAEEIANARMEVERQLNVLRSYIPKSKPSDCDGRGIYVYDLPTKFNEDLLSQCNELISLMDYCKYLSNDAMGEPLPELGKGWYSTHKYALEPIFHSRILNHPCKVNNVEDAKLFYVPYYGGLDILRWHFKNVSNEVKDTLSNELVEWLNSQIPWKRRLGLDHVFVLGKISWDFRRAENGNWGTRLLELDELQNPMKLLIERQPWHMNDVGVPHPTYFHPTSDEDIISWQAKIRDRPRKNLISLAGASREATGSIRSVLIDQCTSAPENCNFFDCRGGACLSPVPVVQLFMESEFCLQPPEDSPTRKSLFDSLVAGCIPVVFDPFTAHYQYPWHLPEDHTKYSVYIDQEEVKASEVNVVEKLVNISLKERQEMRKYIIDELMPRLVYSDPKAKLNKFEDAFSVSMDNLLELAASRLP